MATRLEPTGWSYAPPDEDFARRRVRARRRKRRLQTIGLWATSLAIAIAIPVCVRAFAIEPFIIPSQSMVPTLLVSDRVLGEKVTPVIAGVNQGEVVTFQSPAEADTILIKRVIATEGQTVDIPGDGYVYVDGKKVDISAAYGASMPLKGHARNLEEDISYPITLDEGELWVMGDNREDSLDSRHFGPVSVDAVTSHAFCVIWPPKDAKFL